MQLIGIGALLLHQTPHVERDVGNFVFVDRNAGLRSDDISHKHRNVVNKRLTALDGLELRIAQQHSTANARKHIGQMQRKAQLKFAI